MSAEPLAKFKAARGYRIHELLLNEGVITSRVRVGSDRIDTVVDFSGEKPILLKFTRVIHGVKVENTFTYKPREGQPEQMIRFDPTRKRKGALRKGVFEDVTEMRLSIDNDGIPDVFALVLFAGGQNPEVLAMAKKIKTFNGQRDNERIKKLTDKAMDYHAETLMEFDEPPPGPAVPNQDSPRIAKTPPGSTPARP